jgi:hypothetical protein
MRFGVLYSDGSINIASNSKGENHAFEEAKKQARADKARAIKITDEIEYEFVSHHRDDDEPRETSEHPGGHL